VPLQVGSRVIVIDGFRCSFSNVVDIHISTVRDQIDSINDNNMPICFLTCIESSVMAQLNYIVHNKDVGVHISKFFTSFCWF